MQILSSLVGYGWNQWDRDALAYGLAKSNGDLDEWFVYPLGDPPVIEVRLARDHGAGIVLLGIEAPDELRDRIDVAVAIAGEFELKSWS